MKKIISALLVFGLCFAISTTAFATLKIKKDDFNGQVDASSTTFYNDMQKRLGLKFLLGDVAFPDNKDAFHSAWIVCVIDYDKPFSHPILQIKFDDNKDNILYIICDVNTVPEFKNAFYEQTIYTKTSGLDQFITNFKTANKITIRLSYIDKTNGEDMNYTFELPQYILEEWKQVINATYK